jgi:hypothetical protein
MEIRMTHREDRPHAGFGIEVQYQDRAIPRVRCSASTLTGLQLVLEHVVSGRHPRTTHGRRDCPLCRGEGLA